MWKDVFMIGNDVTSYPAGDFDTLENWLINKDVPVDPDCVFSPFSAVFDRGDGGRTGLGFPRAAWTWQHRDTIHIEVFQTLCPGLSAPMYIRTRTNTITSGLYVWRTYLCQMLMPPEDIDFQINQALGFTIEFRNMIVQTEQYP